MMEELFSTEPVDMIAGGNAIRALNFQAATYWNIKYKEARIEAKKKANLKENIKGEVQYYDQAGLWTLPQRSNDTTISSTTANALSGISLIYDSYAILTAAEGDLTGTVIGQTGFLGTITVVISVNNITITSTEEDFIQGLIRIEHTNEDIGWVITDNYTITMEADTGWSKDTIMLIVDKT